MPGGWGGGGATRRKLDTLNYTNMAKTGRADRPWGPGQMQLTVVVLLQRPYLVCKNVSASVLELQKSCDSTAYFFFVYLAGYFSCVSLYVMWRSLPQPFGCIAHNTESPLWCPLENQTGYYKQTRTLVYLATPQTCVPSFLPLLYILLHLYASYKFLLILRCFGGSLLRPIN
jgi:hypothetical protein